MNEIKTYYSENLKANVTVPEDEPRREWRKTREGWGLMEETETGQLKRIALVYYDRADCSWKAEVARGIDLYISGGQETRQDAITLAEEHI